jgi:hypothetical protein
MVVIAGDIPTHFYGKHPHQEVNLHADAAQWEIYRPFVKRAWRVDRADLMAEIPRKSIPPSRKRPAGAGIGERTDGHLLSGHSHPTRLTGWPRIPAL